jgi:hypothetical protein
MTKFSGEGRVRIPELAPIEGEAAEHVRRLRESHVRVEPHERREPKREREAEPQDWSDWNRWCDARIAAAIEREREFMFEVIGEAMAKFMQKKLNELDAKLARVESLLRSAPKPNDPSAPISLRDRRAAN